MTAVDHAELKRVAEVLDAPMSTKTMQMHTDALAAFGAAFTPRIALALLSEIEGLKAELDQVKAGRKLISSGAMDLGVMYASANERAAEAERQLAALRTQAPDSWRPDREAVARAYSLGFDASERRGEGRAEAHEAGLDAILALRPQTAESGT